MTPPNVKRRLVCPSAVCNYHWEIEVGESERCPLCDSLGEGICACGCGSSLAEMRADAVYRSEACAKRLQRNGRPDIDPTRQPLREVRGQQEEGGASADYLILAREQIARTLLHTGWFTADDLEPLGIPQQYRRSVHGSATGYFSGEHSCMEEAGRRKSERPERKGGKNTVFRITATGRRDLPGLLKEMEGPVRDAAKRLYGDPLAGVGGGFAAAVSLSGGAATGHSPHSGESGAEGRGEPEHPRDPAAVKALGSTSPTSSTQTGKGPAHSNGATLDRPASSQDDSPVGARLLDDGDGESSSVSDVAAGEDRQPEALSLLPEPDPEAWAA